MKVASFFAGVGGIDLAFEKAGFDVIWANEIDPYACTTYRMNFKNTLVEGDVHAVKPEDIPDFDVLVGGFPCQAFSVAGYRKGFEDTRGTLFFELERIIKAKKPSIVFLENVKNLVGHDHGNTYRVIRSHLEAAGYKVTEKVLNACEYGNLPQNRERIYIVGFRDRKAYEKFDFPAPQKLTKKISACIDFEKVVDDRFYYTPEKCGFYNQLKKEMRSSETLYQWRRVYVRENKSNVCPTLTANMGTGGHNVPLILAKEGRIRKLTPRECFNLMGFPKSYQLPNLLAQSHLYKQAGNSVVVPVIERIAKNIMKAVEESKEN